MSHDGSGDTVGTDSWILSDPRGYFLSGFNLFKLANEKLFGFFHLYYIDHLQVYGKNLYVHQLLLCSIDIV